MDIDITAEGAFGSAIVQLEPGESFISEAGAMFRASSNVDIDVTTKSRGKGGLLGGLKRLLSAESFFFSTYRTTDGGSGEVGLAPTLQGEVRHIQLDGTRPLMCSGGSYLGSTPDIGVDTQWQGFRGLFTGEAPFFLELQGAGDVLLSAFGRITEIEVTDALVVDTGHLVAFEAGMDYRMSKAGGSWLHSFLGGEGLVMHFTGQGRVWVQSHNPREYGTLIGRLLPPRRE